MAAPAEDYDTAMSAAANALAARQFRSARGHLLVARAHALRMPQAVGADGASLQRSRVDEIDKLEAQIDKAEARASKFEVFSRWVPG